MIGVLSVIEQWVEEHTPDPSQEGNQYPSTSSGCPDSLEVLLPGVPIPENLTQLCA
jgi:hypothetical protein